MADSTMAIDTGDIVTFAKETVNKPSEVNSTITEIVTKFNAMLETVTGHHHDGTNSRLVYGGIGALTIEEMVIAIRMGTFA